MIEWIGRMAQTHPRIANSNDISGSIETETILGQDP